MVMAQNCYCGSKQYIYFNVIVSRYLDWFAFETTLFVFFYK